MNNEKREQARVLEECNRSAYEYDDDANVIIIESTTLPLFCNATKAGAAALMREAEAATAPDEACFECGAHLYGGVHGPGCTKSGKSTPAPDVSEAELAEILADTNTILDSKWWGAMRPDAFMKRLEKIPRLITALRAARKREGEAVELLRRWVAVAGMPSNNGIIDKETDAFLAARETAAGGGV